MSGALKKLWSCWISIALIIASATLLQASQPPSPAPSKSGNPPQESSSSPKQEAENDIRGTEQSPIAVKILSTDKTKEEREHEAKNEDEKASRERWLVILTGVLALATVCLAIITGRLAYYTRRLWGATNKLVDGANNADAAYILPHLTRHEGFFEDLIMVPGNRPRFRYGFKNHGRTLAIIRRWRDITSDVLPPNPIFMESWEERDVHYIPVIGNELAGEVWTQIPEGMTAQRALALLDNGRWLYIMGEVEYEDIFGVIRIQGYCLRIMSIQPNVWRVWRDGGQAYNYRRKVN